MKCLEVITYHRFSAKLMLPLLGQFPWLHTCPKTDFPLYQCSHQKSLQSRILVFSKPASFEPSFNKENGLHFMIFTVSLKKCGAIAPLIIHVVFVAAAEYFCAIFESGNSFGSIRLRWFENARGILFSANHHCYFYLSSGNLK